MEFLKNNKLFLLLAGTAMAFFLLANTYGFRLLRSDHGTTWSPKGASSIHHK